MMQNTPLTSSAMRNKDNSDRSSGSGSEGKEKAEGDAPKPGKESLF